MKAITLWQPWASLIACGAKTIETRGWATKYRGPLAIHAAKRKMDLDGMALWWEHREAIEPTEEAVVPYGMVVATCELIDVLPVVSAPGIAPAGDYVAHGNLYLKAMRSGNLVDILDQVSLGDFRAGRFAWLLGNIEILPTPVRATGRQQLWEWGQ